MRASHMVVTHCDHMVATHCESRFLTRTDRNDTIVSSVSSCDEMAAVAALSSKSSDGGRCAIASFYRVRH
jgi:hypothetical protein